MTPETVYVAASKADGSVVIMAFVTKGRLNAAGEIFEREPTEENIEAELTKAGGFQHVSWRLIDLADLPASREHRSAWIDTGEEIVVDPKRIVAKPLSAEERLAALEAKIA